LLVLSKTKGFRTTMKRKRLRYGRGFRVALGNSRAQVAEMVIEPGGKEGGPKNRHRGADQWLYVIAGSGTARINGRRITLSQGTLLLIEARDRHEIENSGRALLQTLNVYVPPAYTDNGDELPTGKP